MKKLSKMKTQIILMQILSFIVTIAPLITVFIINWDTYIQTPGDAVKLSMGGIMVLVLLFMKAIGKLKMPQKRLVLYLFLLVMCWLLANVLKDATFLIFMATVGEVADLLICQIALHKMKEQYQAEKTGTVVADKVGETIQKFLGENNNE